MENFSTTRPVRVTQAPRYTAEERAILREIATGPVRTFDLIRLFPSRTVASVKKQLTEERRKLGLPRRQSTAPENSPTMLDPGDPGCDDQWWRTHKRSMAFANSQFVAALQRYAA